MRESDIEAFLRKRVEQEGGKCWKWVSPGRRGVPDRIVLLPYGRICFVELKAPGEKEKPDQVRVQQILRSLGFRVYSSVDSKEKAQRIIGEVMCSEV